MGKTNDWMLDIEDFCNGYFYGFIDQPYVFDEEDFTIEEEVEDVQEYFKSKVAAKYAREYIKRTVEGA